MYRFFPYLLILVLNLAALSQITYAQTSCNPDAAIKMITVSSEGIQGGLRYEARPALSFHGRYTVFESYGQFTSEDTDDELDIYLYNRLTCQHELISKAYTGNYEIVSYGAVPALSSDGRYVAYMGQTTVDSNSQIIVLDRETEQAEVVSITPEGDLGLNSSYIPAISANGRYVTFYSYADNLVDDDINNTEDVFVYDRDLDTISLVSVDLNGQPAGGSALPSISSDGRFVTFSSSSDNLVANDTNNAIDIFVRDLQAGVTTRVSVASNGDQANKESFSSWISGDSFYIVFDSVATNLAPNDSNNRRDIFVHDRINGQTLRVSVATNGDQSDAQSYFYPAISANGQFVIFRSDARTLVPNDTNICTDVMDMTEPNACPDIFIHNRQSGETIRISEGDGGIEGNGAAWNFAISGDGQFAVFGSEASNLVPDDLNNDVDAFLVRLTSSPANSVLERNYFLTQTPTLTWNRVSWGTGYHIQVARDANFSDLVFEQDDIPENELEVTVTPGLESGGYYWRVRALENTQWSSPEAFTVAAP